MEEEEDDDDNNVVDENPRHSLPNYMISKTYEM